MAEVSQRVYDPTKERLPMEYAGRTDIVSCESLLEAVLKEDGMKIMEIVAGAMNRLAEENLNRTRVSGSAQA
jgi:hypothetical protein